MTWKSLDINKLQMDCLFNSWALVVIRFYYKIKGKKVYFEEETKKYQKKLASKIHSYLFNASFLNILTTPIIWFCIVPAVFLDLIASIFQFTCFRVYDIPTYKEIIMFWKIAKAWLTWIQQKKSTVFTAVILTG